MAAEALDADAVATDAAMRRRILRMRAVEMRHRLGDFHAINEVEFTWKRGKDAVSLSERAELLQSASGDFQVKIDNDQDFGMELRYVDGVIYVKSRHGKFHERRSDRAGHEAWREEAMGQLATFFELFDGKITLANMGTATHQGRGAVRYVLATAETSDPALLPPPKPAWAAKPRYPKDGPDAALRHRRAVFEAGEPVSVAGEVLVDRLTGVVLAFDIEGRLVVPPQDARPEPATLEIHLTRTLEGIGRPATIEVPEHLPFEPRPRAVKDPLAFWPPYVAAQAKVAGAAAEGEKAAAGEKATAGEAGSASP